MIPEAILQRSIGPVVLGRARDIVSRGLLSRRLGESRLGLLTLSADVHSSSDSSVVYMARVSIDEKSGTIYDCDCDCPASRGGMLVCKHAVALILDYNRVPGAYFPAGGGATRTSYLLSECFDRMAARSGNAPGSVHGTEEAQPGSIELQMTVERGAPWWSVRFRVVGPGGGYVVKSIERLCENVEAGAYAVYGKNLAFTHVPQAFDEPSRAVLGVLARAESTRRAASALPGGWRGWSAASPSVGRQMRVSGLELGELLTLYLGRTVTLADAYSGGSKGRQLRVVDGDPDVSVEIVTEESGAVRLSRTGGTQFVRCGDRMWAYDSKQMYRCSDRMLEAGDFLEHAFDAPGDLVVSSGDLPRFAATLMPALEKSLGTQAPEELQAMRPRECRLSFYLDRTPQGVTCDARASYGDSWVRLVAGERHDMDGVVRDSARETAALSMLARYFPLRGDAIATDASGRALLPPDDPDAVARLVFQGVGELACLGELFSTPAFDRLASRRRPAVSVGVSMGGGLVDLAVKADDLPQDELYALLSSYRERRDYHRLRDGSFVDMRGLDLSHALDVVDQLGITSRQLSEGEVELPSYSAFLLSALTEPEEQDQGLQQWVERVRETDPTSRRPPAGLAATLRPYQLEGFRWLSSLADLGFGGILADEMGLGKSLQLISFLVDRREEAAQVGPSLVVCPASLVYNWVDEFAKFAPQVDVAPVAGDRTERLRTLSEPGHEVLVTSYELLRRDADDYAGRKFFCQALDEAQYVKNHTTLAARAVKSVDARHRVALTGTPVENRLSELWSVFDFLMPGLLGTYKHFRDRFEQPILGGDEVASARLRAAVGPFILRRLKSQVLTDLPEKMESVVVARLEGEQRRLYDANEQRLRQQVAEGGDEQFATGKLQVLAQLTRLRQLCCDPSLVYEDYAGPSSKLDAIAGLVDTVLDSGQKLLLFSQFTSYLDLVEARLDKRGVKYYRIDGSTPKQRRLALVKRFNADQVPVFLISLKAGGTGLNLTGASVVIHADPWWNAAAQNQATDRAHRIGQTRDVMVYKVIAKDTIEERILKLQEAKSDLADQVVGGETTSLSSLTREDLLGLLED